MHSCHQAKFNDRVDRARERMRAVDIATGEVPDRRALIFICPLLIAQQGLSLVQRSTT